MHLMWNCSTGIRTSKFLWKVLLLSLLTLLSLSATVTAAPSVPFLLLHCWEFHSPLANRHRVVLQRSAIENHHHYVNDAHGLNTHDSRIIKKCETIKIKLNEIKVQQQLKKKGKKIHKKWERKEWKWLKLWFDYYIFNLIFMEFLLIMFKNGAPMQRIPLMHKIISYIQHKFFEASRKKNNNKNFWNSKENELTLTLISTEFW